jgi:hypothetical protein
MFLKFMVINWQRVPPLSQIEENIRKPERDSERSYPQLELDGVEVFRPAAPLAGFHSAAGSKP